MSIPGLIIGGAALDYFGRKSASKDAQRAAEAAAAAQAAGQREYIQYLRDAMAAQGSMDQRAMDLQQSMFDRSMAEQGRGFDLSLAQAQREAAMGGASQLAAAQGGVDMSLGLMGQQMQAQQPQMLAQLGSLQALPYLQAAMGLPSYAMPQSLNLADPMSLRPDLLQNMQNAMGPMSAMMQGQTPRAGAGAGAPAHGAGGTGMGADYTYALQPINVDVSKVLQESPLYQQQLQTGQQSLDRQLAARGLLGSSQALTEHGDLQRSLYAQEMEKNLSRLANMVNFGAGMAPMQPGASFAGPLAGSISGASGIGSNLGISSMMNNAANQRTNLFQNFGANMGNMMGQAGANRAGGLSAMGEAYRGLHTGGIPYQLGAAQVQGPSFGSSLSAGLNLASIYKDLYGGGGLFGSKGRAE
jgi:hypothetical protein